MEFSVIQSSHFQGLVLRVKITGQPVHAQYRINNPAEAERLQREILQMQPEQRSVA